MGQSSSPIISKLGLTMFWGNMWDDKLNFSKKLKEDIFINMFLFLIFTGCNYYSNFYYSTTNKYYTQVFSNLNKLNRTPYYNNFIQINEKNEIQLIKPTKLKFKMHYFGKIWILRFQNWLIVVFHLYIPQTFKTARILENDGHIFAKKYLKNYRNKFFKKPLSFQKNTDSLKKKTIFYSWYLFNFIRYKTFNRGDSLLPNKLSCFF